VAVFPSSARRRPHGSSATEALRVRARGGERCCRSPSWRAAPPPPPGPPPPQPAGPILDADEQDPAGGVGERHDRPDPGPSELTGPSVRLPAVSRSVATRVDQRNTGAGPIGASCTDVIHCSMERRSGRWRR
jgi:hypothetical protein